MERQHLYVLGAVLVVTVFVVMPLAQFMRSTVLSVRPMFPPLGPYAGSSTVDELLIDDMRDVAYVVDDTWSVVGYPPPFEELRLALASRVRVPIYEAQHTPLHTFGLYYWVSFDGQRVTIEAYGINGQRIGSVAGSREYNYSAHANRIVIS